jgi:hypothetical protein
MKTHDELLGLAISSLRSQNVTGIKADHLTKFLRPDQIGKYVPDVTGLHNGVHVILEAESKVGLALQHTIGQWTVFAKAAALSNGYFIAVVNSSDEAAALGLMKRVTAARERNLIWKF